MTENGQQVTYKLLWSPFNYGVEAKVDIQTYNHTTIDEDAYIDKCLKNLGMRLAWGDLVERTEFNTKDYADSELQSSTIGTTSSTVSGANNPKRTIYALNISGTTAKLQSTAGRPTGLMVRPVKYVRVK